MTSELREPDHFTVSADYVFLEGGPSVDAVDALVEGELLPGYGQIRHAIGNQPFHTTLQWRVLRRDAVQRAVERLEKVSVIDRVAVSKYRASRTLTEDEFSIRRSDALAGKGICVICGVRIRATPDVVFAFDGASPGNEVVVRCQSCNSPIQLEVLAE